MQDYLHRDRIVVPVTFCLFFLMENHKKNPRIYYVVLFVICSLTICFEKISVFQVDKGYLCHMSYFTN
jgi:hypothetical protein